MKKPFIVANVREITDAWDREEISYSRMVEMLNEIAEKFYEPKWISVDDRLPENYTSVLVVGGSVRSTALYQDMEFHSDFKLPESKDVTHWMPLPEPPKKD